MAKYLIDSATLTAIANKIREMAPSAWGDEPITPEKMPSGVECAYDDGWDNGYTHGKSVGYADGYSNGQTYGLEALGVLCEWQIVVTSEDFWNVIIANHHPSYYLHCDLHFPGESVANIVISPNGSHDAESGRRVEQDELVYVDNVRWKASAT